MTDKKDRTDAADLGLDPLRLTYRPLADLAADDPKALRDAGTLAVVDLSSHGSSDGRGRAGSGGGEAGPA